MKPEKGTPDRKECICHGCGKPITRILFPPIGNKYYHNEECFIQKLKEDRPVLKW